MLKEIIIAIRSYAEAHRFIKTHRLWKWILIPGIIYAILFMTGGYFFIKTAQSATELILLKTGIKGWMERMQESWLHYLFIIGNIILMLILLLFYFSLFKYLFLILGSPLLAYLSEKTESIMTGKDFPFDLKRFINDIIRGVRIALRNMLWQTVYLISIMILCFIPVIGWIGPPVTLFIECYYLGFSMLDYSAERNQLSMQESISFNNRHKGLAIGNGMVFYLMLLIPLAGWILAPSYAVVASTISFNNARKENIFP